MKKRLFVDMDGVLAVFNPIAQIEDLYEEGYFRNLKPQQNVVDAVKLLCKHPDVEVFILSSVLDSPYALKEKNAWLDEFMPEIDNEHRCFVPYGKEKKDYIPMFNSADTLLDDYSKNLHEWCPPGVGIKLMNGINGNFGTWNGSKVDYNLHHTTIASVICSHIGVELDIKPGLDEQIINADSVRMENKNLFCQKEYVDMEM